MTRRKEAPLDPFKRAVTLTTRSIAADSGMEVIFTSEPPGTHRQDRAAARAVTGSDQVGNRGDPRPCRRRRPCGRLPRSRPARSRWRHRAGRRARCSRQSSRRASRRSAPSACKAWPPISPPAWSSAMSGAVSPRRPSAPKRRCPMRFLFWCARSSPARRRRSKPAPWSISGGSGSREGRGPCSTACRTCCSTRTRSAGSPGNCLPLSILPINSTRGRMKNPTKRPRPRPTPRTPRTTIPRANGAPNFPPKAAKNRCQANSRSTTAMTAWPTCSTGPTLPSCRAARSHGAPIFRCSITPRPSATRCSPAPMTRPSTPRSCATRTSSSACAPFSTSSFTPCMARWRGSPIAFSAGCWPSRTAAGTSISKRA